ncbi:S-layer homology domain-containing protein [Candidatus Peregrinibacteria bacterium]|nr:S-layer homology domain-containing protein [Candidatus Peregrinibacteria bacterium]
MQKKFRFPAAAAILLFVFLGPSGAAAFSDVPDTHRYAADIKYLEEKGIVIEDFFRPDAPVTREVFSAWLLKNAAYKVESYKLRGSFTPADVNKKSNPYAPFIYKLTDIGALSPREKRFRFYPKKAMTRIQALQWIFAVEGIPVPKVFDENEYQAADVDIHSEWAPFVHKAIKLGIFSPGAVRPANVLKRGEAAHLLRTVRTNTPTVSITIVPSFDSDFARNPKYDILAQTWNRVKKSYLHKEDLKADQLIYGSIEGLVKELGDKYSTFERPGDNALLDSLSGQVEGIGAVIQKKEEDIVVVTPIVDSPAEKAGLLPNDIIIKVDEVTVKGMKLTEVVARIKGKKGTTVKIEVRRSGKALTFEIVRDIVRIASVISRRTEDNIAIIGLSDFGKNTVEELQKAADEMKQNQPAGIILDLRNNPGGFLDKSIEVAGFFVKNGDSVARVKYPDHEEVFFSTGTGELAAYPLIILTNGGSASASEIVAGALQDSGIGKIVGEKTFGKGTVQEISDFIDGSSLKLTVAEWLTPKGRSIQKNGIVPDIEVKLTDEERKAGKDLQMERALEEFRKSSL